MALAQSEVAMVISGYVRQNGGTLQTMQSIYGRLVGDNRRFTRWDEAEEKFLDIEWDEETSRRFLEYAVNELEGSKDVISQAYLDIINSGDIGTEGVLDVLGSQEVRDDGVGRTGFSSTQVGDGVIDADYYYYKDDVHITSDLELEHVADQEVIPLRFIPSKRLVIVRNTQPSKVMKINSVLSNQTGLETSSTGNINVLGNDEASSIAHGFINSFEHRNQRTDGGSPNDEPVVHDVVEVDMYNPAMDQSDPVQKADLEGEYDIFEADQVRELRSNGWYERGVGVKMAFRNRIYKVKVAGKKRMGYVKISDVEDLQNGQDLLEIIRTEYLRNFRVLPQTRGLH